MHKGTYHGYHESKIDTIRKFKASPARLRMQGTEAEARTDDSGSKVQSPPVQEPLLGKDPGRTCEDPPHYLLRLPPTEGEGHGGHEIA